MDSKKIKNIEVEYFCDFKNPPKKDSFQNIENINFISKSENEWEYSQNFQNKKSKFQAMYQCFITKNICVPPGSHFKVLKLKDLF